MRARPTIAPAVYRSAGAPPGTAEPAPRSTRHDPTGLPTQRAPQSGARPASLSSIPDQPHELAGPFQADAEVGADPLERPTAPTVEPRHRDRPPASLKGHGPPAGDPLSRALGAGGPGFESGAPIW
jgi:hypothetical protein